MKDVYIAPTVIIKNEDFFVCGEPVAIDHYTVITTRMCIGNYVHISCQVSVIGGRKAQMIIGDFCGIASGAKIICGGDDFDNTIGTPLIPERFNNVDYRQVELEGFNLVGTNSIILPGVKMATGSVLYANSVLKSNTEEWTIYSGNPAIAIKIRNKEKILKDAYEIQQLAIRKNT